MNLVFRPADDVVDHEDYQVVLYYYCYKCARKHRIGTMVYNEHYDFFREVKK